MSEPITRSRSQTPSISSQTYAIPITDEIRSQLLNLSDSESSSDDESSSNDEGSDADRALSSSHNAGDEHSNSSFDNDTSDTPISLNDQDTDIVLTDRFLDTPLDDMNDSFIVERPLEPPGTVIDVSKYIFDSLVQALESTSFSETLARQTKISGIINFKSLELKELIEQTQVKLRDLRAKYESSLIISERIKQDLRYARRKVKFISGIMQTDFPIEFNQAREKVLERNYGDRDPC